MKVSPEEKATHRHRPSADEGASHRHRSPDVVLTADDKGDFPMVFYGPRSKKLDIVMAHYDPDRTAETLDFWLDFLKMEKVAHSCPVSFKLIETIAEETATVNG